jgi:hypothetical protein
VATNPNPARSRSADRIRLQRGPTSAWKRASTSTTAHVNDVMSWHADVDSTGRALEGGCVYILHFDRSHQPPARGSWSLAMYDQRSLPVDNRLHRFSIGDRNELEFNADGSLDIVVRSESAGPVRNVNWLPAPAALFFLILQIHGPLPEALNGMWQPPPIRCVDRFTTPAF